MQEKYEYKMIGSDLSDLKLLNLQGSDGWELVSIVPLDYYIGDFKEGFKKKAQYYFKRKIGD